MSILLQVFSIRVLIKTNPEFNDPLPFQHETTKRLKNNHQKHKTARTLINWWQYYSSLFQYNFNIKCNIVIDVENHLKPPWICYMQHTRDDQNETPTKMFHSSLTRHSFLIEKWSSKFTLWWKTRKRWLFQWLFSILLQCNREIKLIFVIMA